MTEYPTNFLQPDQQRWMRDKNGLYLKSNVPVFSDEEGWLYTPKGSQPEPEKKLWTWPEAWAEPTSGYYQDRHPTRYTWRDDVEEWARYLVDNYDVWCNTYYDHPEGYGRDYDSFDVWGPGGRGDPVDPGIGQVIFDQLFTHAGLPNIEWIIWQAYIWEWGSGWRRFGYDPFTWHYDHIHVTYA